MQSTSIRTLLVVWFALVLLLALSTGSAYLSLGIGNTIANYAIASMKVALIALFFMHLRHASRTVQLAAGTALLFIWILAFLSFGDFLTRTTVPARWEVPSAMQR